MFETSATVIKDAGDDPDITNGMKVVANIAIPFRIDDPAPEDTPGTTTTSSSAAAKA